MITPTAVVEVIHRQEVLSVHHVPIEGLTEHSSFFEARLSSNWCEPAGSQQPVVLQLHISHPTHAGAAQHMLAFISGKGLPQHLLCESTTNTNSSSGHSAAVQQELVLLAHLADKYMAPQLLTTTLQALDRLFTAAGPSLAASTFLLQQFPDSIRGTDGFDRLHKLARAHVLTQLQDLEAVQQQPDLMGVLMQLPYDMLVLLLGSPHTRVAYESSIVAAISWWLAAQPAGCVSQAALQRLASLVRLRGLPATFASNVLPQLGWYTSSCKERALLQALSYIQVIQAAQQHGSRSSDTPPQQRTSSGSGGSCDSGGSSGGSSSRRNNDVGAGRDSSSGRSGSGCAVDRAGVQGCTRALGVALEPLIRNSAFWTGALQPPRELSATQALLLTATLSKGRIATAYRGLFGSGGSTSSSPDSMVRAGEWQPVRDGVGHFGGLQWQLLFRLKAAASRKGSSSARSDQRQQGQQQQLAGSKRRQREFVQQEAAAAAAIAAAAGAGPGGRSQAVMQQVMLDSMEHPGDAGEEAPAQSGGTTERAVAMHASGAGPAAGAAAAAATAGAAEGQAAGRPPGGVSSNGRSAGGECNTSSAAQGSRQADGCCVTWQLQFGVCFSVPYLPEQQGSPRPSLMLQPPQLQHRLAWDPAQGVVTRGQQERRGGVDPSTTPRLLEEGAVLPCVGLLPTMLPGGGGSVWGEACNERLARFLEADGVVRVSVRISKLL